MENITKTLKAHGFELTEAHDSAPCFTDPKSKEVQALMEVCNRNLGMELEPYVMGGGTYSRKLNMQLDLDLAFLEKQNALVQKEAVLTRQMNILRSNI